MLGYSLKDFLFYSYNRYEIETYFEFSLSLLIGFVIYYFFKKYKVDNIEYREK